MQDTYIILTIMGLALVTVGVSLFNGFFQYLLIGIGLILLVFSFIKRLVSYQNQKSKNF